MMTLRIISNMIKNIMTQAENKIDETTEELILDEATLDQATKEAVEEIIKEPSLEEKVKELEDRNLRLLAEMQNIRNRHNKEVKDTREYAITGFANDMITVLENLNRAFDSIPSIEDEIYKKIIEGLNLTYSELKRIFERYGIERVAPNAGEKFDYKVHQAVVQIPTNEVEEGTIAQLIHAGYTIKDRVLRPAMVGVAKKVEESKE